MKDLVRYMLICGLAAIWIGMLLIGGKEPKAQEIKEQTVHWIWPTDGQITDTYGTRQGNHKGIDIAAEQKTPIYAVDSGVVSKSYYSDTYGHVIFIKHKNNFETVYAHLHKRKVSKGQHVSQGDLIGEMGNTGDSSGVHLHFEVHLDEWTYSKENAIDPDAALGSTQIGQVVYAQLQKNEEGSIETAGYPQSAEMNQAHVSYSASQKDVIHTVQSGETLWSISQRYNVSVKSLQETNQLQKEQIVIGQKLHINRGDIKKYTVNSGDTLLSISEKTGASVKEIKQKNNLSSDIIYPEQILMVE